jgi:hypothetical protein
VAGNLLGCGQFFCEFNVSALSKTLLHMLHRYSLGNEGERLEFEAVAITYFNEPMSIKGVINSP